MELQRPLAVPCPTRRLRLVAPMGELGEQGDRRHVAVIDDDESLNRSLVLHLEERGFRVSSFLSGQEALEALPDDPPELALLDVRLKDLSGIDVLKRLGERCPATAVVMITAFHETEVTVEASRLGAFDYLPKPLSLDKLELVLERALRHKREMRRAGEPESGVVGDERTSSDRGAGEKPWRLVGASPPMLEVFKTIGTVAASEATVLLLGESGTGKELVARTIHAHSQRRGAFLSVNCAMLSSEFLASELFGHEKGAFTGAAGRRQGVFELAAAGSLLLDEVSEMDLPIQAKLLRVLQEREFQRLGGTEILRTDARVIAASNRDLEERVAAGAFREDLYFRLAVVPIRLPPLDQRRDDIPLLAEHILRTKTRSPKGRPLALSPEALELLVGHSWQGNVRELENVIVRAGLRARGPVILASDLSLPRAEAAAANGERIERSLEDVEREHVAAVIRHTGGNKARAARILGISRPTLDSKLKRHHLKIDRSLTGD